MAMEPESVYLVVDYDGYRVVATSGGAQTTLAGTSPYLDEVLRQALYSRGGPIAVKLTPA